MTRSENSLNGGETVAKEPFGFFEHKEFRRMLLKFSNFTLFEQPRLASVQPRLVTVSKFHCSQVTYD